MNFGRVFEAISDAPQETDVLELLRTGAEVARNNARTHGLTAELAPKSVLEWYRIILNDPTAELPVMDALSDEQRLAVNLAQAEVRLRGVLHAIDEFEQERDPLFEELANQEHDYQLYLRLARNRSLDKWTRDASKILLQIIAKDIRKGQRQIKNRARLLQRYKREALSKQRKAQKAWCDQFKRDLKSKIPKRNFLQSKGEIFTSEYSNTKLPKPAIE